MGDWFTDGWNWFWGTWWPTITWGPAATWVGSLLSAVSTFLALRLIWVERDRRENAQAYLQTIRIKRDVKEGLLEAVEVWLFNGSEAPLPAVSFHMRLRGRPPIPARVVVMNRKVKLERSIPPKSEVYEHMSLIIEKNPHFTEDSRIDIYFRDGNNRVWRKDMTTYKLKRVSERYVTERSLLV
jgi:hypothetical protein